MAAKPKTLKELAFEKVRKLALKKAKDLGATAGKKFLEKVGISKVQKSKTSKNTEGKKAGKPVYETPLAAAAAAMGHAGKGSKHRITEARRAQLRRGMGKVRAAKKRKKT